MDFGKLNDISTVDFKLPKDPIENSNRLAALKKETPAKIMLGCTGWSNKEWKGSIYPKAAKPAEFLHHYSKQFGTLEMNTTHYRLPDREQVIKWYKQADKDFWFCPKLPQSISHRTYNHEIRERMKDFSLNILEMQEKLGCCFMQLPPYFGVDRWSTLQSFLSDISIPIPLAIEFRKEDWFEDSKRFSQQIDWIHKKGFHTVITDVAGRRDVLHSQLAGKRLCLRFVGNEDESSDQKRLNDWLERFESWIPKGLTEIYFFVHQPNITKAAELCVYLKDQIRNRFPEMKCKAPDLRLGAEPQMKLF